MNELVEKIKEFTLHLPMVVMPTRHFLLDGMYARQILIPAGTAIVGRLHKKFHYFLCLAGGAWIQGDDRQINIKAGMLLLCAPGSQRIGVTYADSIFVTIHRTEETLLKNIEDDCVEFSSTGRYSVGNEILEYLPEAL